MLCFFLTFNFFSNATHQVNLHKMMLGLKKANLDYLIELKKITKNNQPASIHSGPMAKFYTDLAQKICQMSV